MENLTDTLEIWVCNLIEMLGKGLGCRVCADNRRSEVTGVCGFKNTLFRSDIHFHIDTPANRRAGDRFRVFDGCVLCLEGETKALDPRQIKARQVPKMLVAVNQFHASVYSFADIRNKGPVSVRLVRL